MAGDWIKMRADLLTHPKIVRMSSALKADKLRVIGALHSVWCLFDMHSADGQLEGYTPEVLDDHLGWAGFSAQMIVVKWLEHTADSLNVPRFDEHNGQSAKRRATETERKRLAREAEALDVGKASASGADTKRTREEKSREEKKDTKEAGAPAFVLPDWIPADTWAAYCKVRTGKKAKNEPHALGLIVKDLEKFRAAGHDPVDCLNNSIKSGWAGVFEPKAKFADKNTLPPVSTVWHESAAGVIAKAAELRLAPRDEVLETFPAFKARVLEAAGELVGA
jgi:hypothetical protein